VYRLFRFRVRKKQSADSDRTAGLGVEKGVGADMGWQCSASTRERNRSYSSFSVVLSSNSTRGKLKTKEAFHALDMEEHRLLLKHLPMNQEPLPIHTLKLDLADL